MPGEVTDREAIVRGVVERCAATFLVPVDAVMAASTPPEQRDGPFMHASRARQAAWYLLHRHLGFSQVELSRRFARDHTTVAKGIERIDARMRSDEATRLLVFEAAGASHQQPITVLLDDVRRQLGQARDVVRRLEALATRLEREAQPYTGPRRTVIAGERRAS
jgi:hypothetical protein